jgi:hypothetical protein
MAIEKEEGKFILYCDICGETADRPFVEFRDAVNHKKENGWRSRLEKDGWVDICPECQGAK